METQRGNKGTTTEQHSKSKGNGEEQQRKRKGKAKDKQRKSNEKAKDKQRKSNGKAEEQQRSGKWLTVGYVLHVSFSWVNIFFSLRRPKRSGKKGRPSRPAIPWRGEDAASGQLGLVRRAIFVNAFT